MQEANAQDLDIAINQVKLVLVDFYADWCGPCQVITPILEEISSELGDKAVIIKLDVDKNFNVAERYGVLSIPTLVIFKEGKELDRKVGALSKEALVSWIKASI